MTIEENIEETTNDEEVTQDGESLSSVLEAAFDEHEDEPSSAPDESGDAPAGASGSDDGRGEAQADTTDDSGDGAKSDVVSGDKGHEKPPVDWSPELREEWSGLPEPVRAKIADRERGIAQAMQGTADARRVAQGFGQLANQYGSVIAAEGAQHPMQLAQSLFQTVAELRMGTPTQKAAKLADLVSRYDIDISALDDALSERITGEPGQHAQQSELEQMLEQKMAPVNEMMQQLAGMQQRGQQASQQDAMNEVNEFAQTAEFLNDVRHDVADLIDMATKQGRAMSLQEAYDKACAMHPEISNVMAQRAEQERLSNASNSVASKRNAASSLKPRGNGNQQTGGDSLYDSLSAAWDQQIG